ncbi:hypothetical protein MAP00_000287 [Monascus purpureus]|nr:hypothetical protein MAP00_000287 [Monascus purpureus]
MASNDRGRDNEKDNAPTSPIPLQDLSRPPNTDDVEDRGRGRPSGMRRSLLPALRNYQRIAEVSSPETSAAERNPFSTPYASDREHNAPFLDDPAGFAQAMSSVGLSFEGAQHTTTPSAARPSYEYSDTELDNVPLSPYATFDHDRYISPAITNEDTTHLTDQTYLQPISGSSTAADKGRTVRFEDDGYSIGSRLGDDLPHLEAGSGGRKRGGSASAGDRSRSLSPSSPSSAMHRASSMVKLMSQRVVNLTNEPEVIEHSIQKEESLKSSRLEGPPELPAMTDHAHDAPFRGSLFNAQASREKKQRLGSSWRYRNNPLKGRTLGIFGPNNPIRTRLCDILVHPLTEPLILLLIILQTVLLTIESSSSKFTWNNPSSKRWGSSYMDYCFLAIFIIYSLETISRIVVSGFVFNPAEYSTLDRSLGWKQAVLQRSRNIVQPHREASTKKTTVLAEPQVSILRTFTGLNQLEEQAVDDRQRQRIRLARRAFLRHSFNRLDFVAVVSFWVYFCLSLKGVEVHRLFRMLSCLRILRLLSVTNGTSVILQSLKKAAPLLVHVAFLISFFWLIFAIIGNQSFKSSLRRTCVWIDPLGQNNFTQNGPDSFQFCGGYYTDDWEKVGWVREDDPSHPHTPKGYICPPGSICVQGSNPFNGTVSFDDILHSIELVFVIMSSNTFTDLMYYTTDSDFLPAALFFAFGIVILSLWLVNLLVAVITHSFQVIREESKRSAFAVQKIDEVDRENLAARKVSQLKHIYDKTSWFWVCVILFDLIVMALRSASMGKRRADFIDDTEIVVTLVLLVEIILRFASDWRVFHRNFRNWVDLGLAIVTCIIQIPPIKNSGRPYSILTLFQILRVYRVILWMPMTRDLIMIVFRNTVGLLNLIMFVFLITFLAAIFATQLFRGQIPPEDSSGNNIATTFSNIYNSFLGMYQILSSENWTDIMYSTTTYTARFGTAWISAAFFILWFIVANFVVLNMFIAVIQESFDVSEDEKRLHQVRSFLEQKHAGGPSQANMSLAAMLKWGRDPSRFRDPLDHGPAALELLLKDAVVREFLDERETPLSARRRESMPQDGTPEEQVQPGFLSRIWTSIANAIVRREPNPFYAKLKFSRGYEELDPKDMAQQVVSAAEERKRAQREYLMKHPNYNKSLFIFAPDNPIRHFCQRIVGPGRGDQRVQGVEPYKTVWIAFSIFIYAAIVAMVLLACITTPIYQWKNFHSNSNRNWFIYTDLGFSVLFTVEAVIKVIADGFFWTPNAYLRSSWGFIDGVVLVTLWINVITSLSEDWRVSRVIGAFKALRALRLLNVSDSARNTFHSVVIVGGWNVISAAAVSMSLLIPFAIYAVNLFSGQLVQCNDGNINGSLNSCIDEYASSPYNWDVLAPRAASNPFYDFDNFGQSLFILFQIVSQEGWIDVQQSVMSITGVGMQPQNSASNSNGLFFVIFNLLGAVFVLTLFVSVFMRNYTEQTGVAFLTAEQRSWLELRKHLRQVSPSKRSVDSDSPQWRKWCYRVAVKKHGRWAKFVTVTLLLDLLLLILEFYPEKPVWEKVRGRFAFYLFNPGKERDAGDSN